MNPAALAPLSGPVPGPVAILGAGVSGAGVRRLLEAARMEFETFDAAGTPFSAGLARRFRSAVFSPGFPPGHPWLALARAAGLDCWGELDFASLFWKGRIVAVTGTNGKTTLTEFLVQALRSAGCSAVAAGNIGEAFSHVAAERSGGTPDEIAVCEVSSFQAETLRRFRAEATLWTNFAEDHLERHGTMRGYFLAKARVAARSDRVFVGTSVVPWLAEAADQPWAKAAVRVPTLDPPSDTKLAGTVFERAPQRENFALAAAWWKDAGLPAAPLHAAAARFRLGRHRLSRVAEARGITYWNDSKATNFHAVEAALTRFPGPVWLIAGGKAKGGDIAGFVRRIAPRVREAFLIGDTAAELAQAAAAAGLTHRRCATLSEAVAAAAAAASPGGHVLLSPGFASFDLFRNYQDRGDQFEAVVRSLAKTSPVPCQTHLPSPT